MVVLTEVGKSCLLVVVDQLMYVLYLDDTNATV